MTERSCEGIGGLPMRVRSFGASDTVVGHGNGSNGNGANAAWAAVHPRLVAFLMARGLDRETAADLAQETCVRVLARQVRLASVDDLYRYARRVAFNLLVGRYRRVGRVHVEELGELVDEGDVTGRAEARVHLDRVWECLARLALTERQAVVYEVIGRPAWDAREEAMWKMRRSRARTKLRELLEGCPVLVGLRRAWWWLVRQTGVPELAAATGWIAPAVGAVLTGLVPIVTGPSSPPPVATPTLPALVRVAAAADEAERPVSSMSAPARRAQGRSEQAPPPVPDVPHRPAPIVSTPTAGGQVPGGSVTPHDDEDLHVCTTDDPVLGTGCPVSLNPWAPLEDLPAVPPG